MASIRKRGNKYCVIYNYTDKEGARKQKWETYKTFSEAKKRKKEVEYKQEVGEFVIPKCTTVRELFKEYVEIYGREKWALSTYEQNTSKINNYILPAIGDVKLEEINVRFIERFYKELQTTKAVDNPYQKPKGEDDYVTPSGIRDIHKLLRSCFKQAVKWELMDKNPAEYATVPKYEAKERDIWTAETLMYALSVCKDENLALAIHLSFSCSLRIGEILGLTWDCVDISEEAVSQNKACLYVNKVVQRVSKEAMKQVDKKDVIFIFPEDSRKCTTVRVLKKPKTKSSIRKVFLPATVADMLAKRKQDQEELKGIIEDEYHDYNLVFASSTGLPYGAGSLRKSLAKLIKDYDLPEVVFHSLRHTSITYKLKLNGGDVKAVQGDSGHSQTSMVTDVYSHILDEDRKRNAELFEEAFYQKKDTDPAPAQSQTNTAGGSAAGRTVMEVPEGVDPGLLQKVLANPEMAALLTALARSMKDSEDKKE